MARSVCSRASVASPGPRTRSGCHAPSKQLPAFMSNSSNVNTRQAKNDIRPYLLIMSRVSGIVLDVFADVMIDALCAHVRA